MNRITREQRERLIAIAERFNIGDRVMYRYYGIGVVRERVATENGEKYLIEFERVMAWMMPNHLLTRIQEEKWTNKHSS